MSCTIAFSGKGGSGKTTIAALAVKHLIARGAVPVFAVDADPNSNFADQLGVKEYGTVGDIREELRAGRGIPAAGMSKPDAVNYRIQEIVSESDGFDLLNMGRPEGPGCYCYVNSLLREYIDGRGKNYPFVIIDNEAGMEHISRRTTRDVELLLVVCDPTAVSLTAAVRIGTLARSLDSRIKRMGALINRSKAVPHDAGERLNHADLEVFGAIPEDPEVARFALEGRPLLEISDESPAYRSIAEVLERVLAKEVSHGRS